MNANFTMYPVIDHYSLEEAVNKRFGVKIKEINSLLFDDDYQNDCLKRYSFEEDLDWQPSYTWCSEENVKLENLVRQYLREELPGHDIVLIDVSW